MHFYASSFSLSSYPKLTTVYLQRVNRLPNQYQWLSDYCRCNSRRRSTQTKIILREYFYRRSIHTALHPLTQLPAWTQNTQFVWATMDSQNLVCSSFKVFYLQCVESRVQDSTLDFNNAIGCKSYWCASKIINSCPQISTKCVRINNMSSDDRITVFWVF